MRHIRSLLRFLCCCALVVLVSPSRHGLADPPADFGQPADGKRPVASCVPTYADPSELQIDSDVAVLMTHFTSRLDELYLTRPGLKKLTQSCRQHKLPLIYLQEPHAPQHLYFHADCEPTAYIASDLGRFDFETRDLNHLVVAGGFYELCLDNTVKQIVENWSDIKSQKELHITYVTDAIYSVASDCLDDVSNYATLRSWMSQQPSPTFLLSDALEQIQSRDAAWKFLAARWSKIPPRFGLHVRFRGEITAVRFADPDYPTITVRYATVEQLAHEITTAAPNQAAIDPSEQRKTTDAQNVVVAAGD